MWAGIIATLCALIVYSITAKPDIVGGDPGEFQFVPWVLGIPHHTGYPLYTLAGWAWSQVPFGSVAYRMNLFSALTGSVAVGFAAYIASRLSERLTAQPIARAGIGLVAGLALLVAPIQWQWATIAGVRAGAVAEVGWMLAAAIGALAVVSSPDLFGRRLIWLALAVGVGLAHHRSGVLALPGIAMAIVSVPSFWRLSRRVLIIAFGLVVLPLITYAYLPIRGSQGPPFQQWHPETWDGFIDLVLAVEHSRVHFLFPLAAMRSRADLLERHLLGEFGPVGLALAAVGCVWLLIRWPRAWVVLAGAFLLQSWQVLNWDVGPDQLNAVYQLPAHLVVAAWIGLGAGVLGWIPFVVVWRLGGWGRTGRSRNTEVLDPAWSRRALIATIPLIAVLALVSLSFVARGRNEWTAQFSRAVRPVNHDRSILADGFAARRIIAGGLSRVEPNAVVVGDWEQATALWYLQFVERFSGEVQVVYPVDNLNAAIRDFPSRPIWLMARTAVPPNRRLSGDGPFVRVTAPDRFATAVPPGVAVDDVEFEDSLALVGHVFGDRSGNRRVAVDSDGDVLPVTLFWRARGATRKDLSISVRLLSDAGAIAAQQDNSSPVLSLYPTSRWSEGEVVGDYYELPYRSLPSGDFRLVARVYLAEGGGFRDLRAGASDQAEITRVSR